MAEGAPLLRAYTLTRIEGSNPFLSATQSGDFQGHFISSKLSRKVRDLSGDLQHLVSGLGRLHSRNRGFCGEISFTKLFSQFWVISLILGDLQGNFE